MKHFPKKVATAALMILLLLATTSCLEEKVIELVLSMETEAVFPVNEVTDNINDPLEVEIGLQIEDALASKDYSREDIVDAFFVGVEYGVTSFDQATPWELTTRIELSSSLGGTVELVPSTQVVVPQLLGGRFDADVSAAGVDMINAALDNFLAGGNPTLTFTLEGYDITPDPSPSNPMIFEYKAWLTVQVITEEELEVPDPF